MSLTVSKSFGNEKVISRFALLFFVALAYCAHSLLDAFELLVLLLVLFEHLLLNELIDENGASESCRILKKVDFNLMQGKYLLDCIISHRVLRMQC